MDDIQHKENISKPAGRCAALYLAIGWIAAAASLVRFPYLFGVASVMMGIIAYRQGSRAAMTLIASSIVLMAIGLIFNEVFYNSLRQALNI